ncbi:Arylsulfatase A [Tenacibaculum sp. MAR_2009_124]|uniref:sulfatase n=1 Tax=Tenacibaculum sp. MAR_2009_124 TaxID=1250059 RepID=UPI00089D19F6|nr:sulfatase [Tenacibaculum sp. MAR_2009_124]SED14004.1 Arylsulfatase A [Tenacibaculum sp. MAR_2009_124]
MHTKKIMKIATICYVFFLLSLLFTLESCGQTKNIVDKKKTRPNIVLFFVDDLGWSDLGMRNPVFETPNIDKLAKSGVSFEQAYIASPTCSPSRATLLTGKHPARLKLVRHIPHGEKKGFDRFGRTTKEFHTLKRDPAQFPSRNWLPLENITYAEALSKLGYYNLFVGKWHVGHENFHPVKQGFNKQIGTSNFGHPKAYYPPYFRQENVYPDTKGTYLTDKLTNETINFISKYDKQQPFMVSFFYYSVHSPHQGRKDLVNHFKSKGLKGKYAHYAAMVKATDESVGSIVKAIEEKGIEKETIFIFLSDQGGYFENLPFRGGKISETLFEGGARVPFFLHWPGVTISNSINNSLVQSTDLFPTLIEIAEGNTSDYKNIDGISLLPIIKTNNYLERDPIYGYRAYEDLYVSVREKDWKLLAYRSGKVQLFNITNDIKEQNDLSKEKPDVVKQLIKKLIKWEAKMGVASYSGVQ